MLAAEAFRSFQFKNDTLIDKYVGIIITHLASLKIYFYMLLRLA